MISKGRYNRRFRLAFGPFVSRSCLRSAIRAGRPLPSHIVTAMSAVVAIKNSEYTGIGDDSESRASAVTVLAFQGQVSDLFKKAGATIIGAESDLVTVSFGSPLERVFLRGKRKVSPYEGNIHALAAPALRAVEVISEIIKRPECNSWHFGLDLGNCSYAWNNLSGYFALGLPVQRARILSRFAGRYETRIIISAPASEALPDLALKKLGTLKKKDGSTDEAFYSLNPR